MRCDACGAETTIARLLELKERPDGSFARLCPACRSRDPGRAGLSFGAEFVVMFLVAAWAYGRSGASLAGALLLATLVALMGWVSLLVHELAHSVAVWCAGGRVLEVRLGEEPARLGISAAGVRWSIGSNPWQTGACQYWLPPERVTRRALASILRAPRTVHLLLAAACGLAAVLADSGLLSFACAWQLIQLLRHGRSQDAAKLAALRDDSAGFLGRVRSRMTASKLALLLEDGERGRARIRDWTERHREALAADGPSAVVAALALEAAREWEQALAWCEAVPAPEPEPGAASSLALGEPDLSRRFSFRRVRLLLLLDRPDDALALARANLAAATSPEEEALRRCDVIDGLLVRDDPDDRSVREAMAQAADAWAALPWAPMVATCRAMALAEGASVDEALSAAEAAAAVAGRAGEPAPHHVLDAYRAIALWRVGRTAEARSLLAGWDLSGMPPPLVRRMARITAD